MTRSVPEPVVAVLRTSTGTQTKVRRGASLCLTLSLFHEDAILAASRREEVLAHQAELDRRLASGALDEVHHQRHSAAVQRGLAALHTTAYSIGATDLSWNEVVRFYAEHAGQWQRLRWPLM